MRKEDVEAVGRADDHAAPPSLEKRAPGEGALDQGALDTGALDESVLAEELRGAIGRLVRTARAADVLPPGEAAILGHLDREGPQTAAELAQRRAVSHQSAARSAKELIGTGLVESGPHPTDGRKHLLYLTEAGRELLHGERRGRADRLADAIRHELSAAERETLEHGVRLLSRLDEYLRHDRAR